MSGLSDRYPSDGRNYRKTYGAVQPWNDKSKLVPPECIFPGLLVYLTWTNELQNKSPRRVVIKSYVWYYLNVKFVWASYEGSDELVRLSFGNAYLI